MPREIRVNATKQPNGVLVGTISLEDFDLVPKTETYTETVDGKPVEKTRTKNERKLLGNAAHTLECTEDHAHSVQACLVAKAQAASWTCGRPHVHAGDPKLGTGCFTKRTLKMYLTEILDARNAAPKVVDLTPADPVIVL